MTKSKKIKTKYFFFLSFFLLFFIFSYISSAFAGMNQWTTNGPGGAETNSVSLSPNYAVDNTIFAGTYNGGIYKSTDGGQNWTQVNNGLSYWFVFSVSISPNYSIDNTVFAGVTWGVYKSTDGGQNWTQSGLANTYVTSISLSPNYAVDNTVFAGTGEGVYKSTDGGQNWTQSISTNNITVFSVSLSPNYSIDNTVFAGTRGGGVYKSTDGGQNWTQVNNGLYLDVRSVSLSPNYIVDNTIFAGTWGYGIYKSTDGGQNWTQSGLAIVVNSVSISPNYLADNNVFAGTGAGVYKSTDGGQNWTQINNGLLSVYVYSVSVSPNYLADKTIFAGINISGVFSYTFNQPPVLNPIGNKSVGEGGSLSFTVAATDTDNDPLTLTASNLPLGATFLNGLFSWNPGLNQSGIYPNIRFEVSDGNGGTDYEDVTITVYDTEQLNWQQVNIDGFGNSSNTSIRLHTFFNSYLYAQTDNNSGAQVWRSSEGTSWTQVVFDGFGDANNKLIRRRAIFNGSLYFPTGNSVTGTEIWQTLNGTDWNQVNIDGFGDPKNYEARALGGIDGYLYFGTSNNTDGAEVWRSYEPNNPASWLQINISGFGDANNNRTSPGVVYGGFVYSVTNNNVTGAEVWRYEPSSNTWTQLNTDGFGDANNRDGIPSIFNGNLYVSTRNPATGGRIYKYDSGTNWTEVAVPGFGDTNNFMLRLNPDVTNGTIYAGTKNSVTGGEVWRSTNGTDWTQINIDGFMDNNNDDNWPWLTNNGYLYSGTENFATGGEIWRMYVGFPIPADWFQLTDNSATDDAPKWRRNPDGSKIAFKSERSGSPGKGDIWVMSSATLETDLEQLTTDPLGDGWPEWSPDGSQIAFWSQRIPANQKDIYVMPYPGGLPQTQLTNIGANEGHPDISPNGQKIIFSSAVDGSSDIWIMNINGTEKRNLTNTLLINENHPNYNFDGNKIAYQSNEDSGNWDIWVADIEPEPVVLGPKFQLTSGPDEEKHLGWSPNGNKIVHDKNMGSNWDLWVTDVSTLTSTQLTFEPSNENNPDWSPDGKEIAFDSNISGNREIYKMAAPDVLNPQVSITSPTEGQVISSFFDVFATIDDLAAGGSSITGATYSIDGGLPNIMNPLDGSFDSPTEITTTQLDTKTIPNGPHTLTVRGTDSEGNTGERTVNIIVNNNMIKNGSFEIDADSNGIPDYWTPTNFATGDGRSADYFKDGNYSLKIISAAKLKKVTQRIELGGNIGDKFTLSGWNKNVGTTSGGLCIRAYIYLNNTDGTKTSASIAFYRYPHDWKIGSVNITANKAFNSIDVLIANVNQTGVAYFDDFRLVKQ